MKRLALILSLLALAAFGLVACGDDDDDDAATEATTEETTTEETTAGGGGGGGGGGTVQISAAADGSLAFEETEVSAPAGEVTVEFDNPASVGHDVVVESSDDEELIRTDVISGDQTTASGELEAGDYTFYCSVPGHREAGMEGTLTAE
jgi:plastocyanin